MFSHFCNKKPCVSDVGASSTQGMFADSYSVDHCQLPKAVSDNIIAQFYCQCKIKVQ